MQVYDIIVIGSGPAGYTAAIYGARAELNVLLLEGSQPGGQLTITTEVENYPGFPDGIDGFELVDGMKKQAKRFGTTIVTETVDGVDFEARPMVVDTSRGNQYLGKSVVISTGAKARYLGLESEKRFMNRGISACATCDGYFFKNKSIVVVGGGDSAMEEALFLTKFATVTLVHRRNSFRASKIMLSRARSNPKITFLSPWNIVEINGSKRVESIRLRHSDTGEEKDFDCQGIFMAIGHTPNSAIFETVEKDENQYIVTKPGTTETNIPGVFACGDVQDHRYRQAITAASSGCMAAIDAEHYLNQSVDECQESEKSVEENVVNEFVN